MFLFPVSPVDHFEPKPKPCHFGTFQCPCSNVYVYISQCSDPLPCTEGDPSLNPADFPKDANRTLPVEDTNQPFTLDPRVLHGGFKLYQHLWYRQCPEKWNKGLARKGWMINFTHQELMLGWYNVPHLIYLMKYISIFRFKFHSIMQSFMISQMDFTKLMFIFLLSHQGPSKSGICKLRNCRTFLIEGS